MIELLWQSMGRQMVYACVIFAAVLLVLRLGGDRWARRSPRLVYAFWGLVMLRLVLPVDLASPIGFATLVHEFWPEEVASSGLPASAPVETAAALPAPGARAASASSVGWPAVALGAWLLASVGFAWRSLRRRRPFVLLAQRAAAVDDPVALLLLERWRQRHGIRRRVRLVSGPADGAGARLGPFTVGTLRPIVWVPARVVRRPQLLDAVLGHELAHVRRFDDLRLLGQEWVRALWVPFPLVHFVAARMRLEREKICDVLATGPGCLSRRRYLAALRTLLDDGLVPVRAVPGLGSASPGIFSTRKRSMRFDSLLSEPGPSTVGGKLAYLAVLLLLVPMAPMIDAAPAPSAPTVPEPPQPAPTPAVAPAPPAPSALPSMINPMPGEKVTSGFGLRKNPFEGGKKVRHTGIDLRAQADSKVLAPADGVVVMATELWPEHEAWGTVLILEHAEGLQTFYAHLDSIAVEEGQRVRQGQVVAVPGSTGKSTGPHLHFEVHRDWEPIDPSILVPDWR